MIDSLFAKAAIIKKMDNLARTGIVDTNMAKFFRYARVKGVTLVFVFKQDCKFDFRYAKNMILDNLRKAYAVDITGFKKDGIVFSNIACVTIKEEQKQKEAIYPKIADKSNGDFINNCKNPSCKKLFEDIRVLIKK